MRGIESYFICLADLKFTPIMKLLLLLFNYQLSNVFVS